MDPREPLLRELVARLDELAPSLGTGDAAAEEAAFATWRECSAVFEELQRVTEALEDRTVGPELARLLDQARRSHAVATSLAVRERDRLAVEMRDLKESRVRLQGFAGVAASDGNGSTGSSCDVSG